MSCVCHSSGSGRPERNTRIRYFVIVILARSRAEKARAFEDEVKSPTSSWSDLYDNSFNCERLEAISGPYVSELDDATSLSK